ncbi:MAG TPA: carboxypeptidase regulatory-like domain-containing protein [Bryobacteraceae bacterium]|nr:carboxypeptidase regulatory-like domain-containing protein [Bryobacteraceae bacterium]
MKGWRIGACIWLMCAVVCVAAGSEYHGELLLNGVPVPGVSVIATNGKQEITTTSDDHGVFSFPDLAEGTWNFEVSMTGFAVTKHEVTVNKQTPPAKWDLTLLPPEQTMSQAAQSKSQRITQNAPLDQQLEEQALDGLLINGSLNNGAASPYRQNAAFGNNRRNPRALYNGGIAAILGNSVFDAKPFSLTGQNTPKPSYSNVTGIVTFGGPLRIPHVIPNGPNVFIGYQWTRDHNAVTETALVPTLAQRSHVISRQAEALLALYPLPNFTANSRYNYQTAAVSARHQDALQARFDKVLSKNQFSGRIAFQDTRSDTPNVLGYSDSSDILGINTRLNWSHRLQREWLLTLGYQFSRLSTKLTPYFAYRSNISGNAGITGNNQDPVNWGPPTLVFSSGLASLTDGLPASNHNQTNGESVSLLWTHRTHNVTMGGDYRREQFNYLTQENPRGTFTFTGAATGSDFEDFLLGIPDTSSVAFGNADKYLRQAIYDGYVADDWRVNAAFTLNAGIRWEYGAPITELFNRLVNLDVTPGFASVAPVLASNPIGPLTGQRLPSSLMRPDRSGWEPRVGIAWRPLPASSLVVRAGYGVYYDTSVYQSIAVELAQQPPFSKTLTVQNSPLDPLTLENGFKASPAIVPNTFAIDPNFRVGYAQQWQLSIQQDLPGSMQLTAIYSGIKGTRGLQEFLPNTFPIGAANPCLACDSGYVYVASNGNSIREAAQLQLRRRLHNGFTAQVQYTFAKSIDDDSSLGGQEVLTTATPTATPAPQSSTQSNQTNTTSTIAAAPETPTPPATIAQNWLNLRAERGLSSFDQRHLVSMQIQYTTGMGMGGGTLLSGWRGALLKEWTFAAEITAGSGLPQTPIYLAAVPGTGVTGSIRPEYSGAPLYRSPAGFFLNPAAYMAPLVGQWGNAGRNTITGPAEFALNATMGRTFRLKDRLNLDVRLDATNALNHVTYASWNTIINNAQFGLPVAANAMRSVQMTARLRF